MFADGAEESDHFRGDSHGDFDDGFVGRFASFLGEVSDDGVFVAFDGAFIGTILVEDHAEESGLAGAVRADEGDAFAPVDGHFGFAKERAAAESFGDFVDGEHGGGVDEEGAVGKDFGRDWDCWEFGSY